MYRTRKFLRKAAIKCIHSRCASRCGEGGKLRTCTHDNYSRNCLYWLLRPHFYAIATIAQVQLRLRGADRSQVYTRGVDLASASVATTPLYTRERRSHTVAKVCLFVRTCARNIACTIHMRMCLWNGFRRMRDTHSLSMNYARQAYVCVSRWSNVLPGNSLRGTPFSPLMCGVEQLTAKKYAFSHTHANEKYPTKKHSESTPQMRREVIIQIGFF